MNDSEPNIVDNNGIPTRAEDIPALVLPSEQAVIPIGDSTPENVVELPPPQLERTAKIKACGDRRAISLLFETRLDGSRVNLLLARIYVAAENAEREVMALGDRDVEIVLKRFKEGQAGA